MIDDAESRQIMDEILTAIIIRDAWFKELYTTRYDRENTDDHIIISNKPELSFKIYINKGLHIQRQTGTELKTVNLTKHVLKVHPQIRRLLLDLWEIKTASDTINHPAQLKIPNNSREKCWLERKYTYLCN